MGFGRLQTGMSPDQRGIFEPQVLSKRCHCSLPTNSCQELAQAGTNSEPTLHRHLVPCQQL